MGGAAAQGRPAADHTLGPGAQPAARAGKPGAPHQRCPAPAGIHRSRGSRGTPANTNYPGYTVPQQNHPGDLRHGRPHP